MGWVYGLGIYPVTPWVFCLGVFLDFFFFLNCQVVLKMSRHLSVSHIDKKLTELDGRINSAQF